jgi:hypothetical protein
MNTLKKIFCSTALLFSLSLSAQKNESAPELPFSNKIEVSEQFLESIFQASGNIAFEISPGFKLKGRIQNKSNHGNSVVSMLIQLEGSPGGMLSISRYTDQNGRLFYTGHLMKLHESSGLMLVEKDQHHYFIETQQKFLVTE